MSKKRDNLDRQITAIAASDPELMGFMLARGTTISDANVRREGALINIDFKKADKEYQFAKWNCDPCMPAFTWTGHPIWYFLHVVEEETSYGFEYETVEEIITENLQEIFDYIETTD